MILHAWKDEVEKKPPEMSMEDAYATLGLKTGQGGYGISALSDDVPKTNLRVIHLQITIHKLLFS